MRWHLFVQELSAALLPPSLTEGAAEKLTSFPCRRTKTGTARIPPTVKLACVEKRRKTDGSGYCQLFGVVESEGWDWSDLSKQRTRWRHRPWTVKAGIPKLSSPNAVTHLRDVSSTSALAMPKTGYYSSRLTCVPSPSPPCSQLSSQTSLGADREQKG